MTICFNFRDSYSERLPGHWQLQGYGHPHYTNINYPFPANPPFVPSENPTGLYETEFSVPDHWRNDVLYRLRFEGVDSAYHLWVNGQMIGYSQGSRNAAEFDISNVIRKDEINILRVKVYQWSDGSYIEDQDMWVCISCRFPSSMQRSLNILSRTKDGFYLYFRLLEC